MAAAGENCAGDTPVQRGEKSQGAFFEGEDCIAATELDPVFGGDVVDGGGINAECANRIIQFMRCSIRGRQKSRGQKTPQPEKLHPNPHIRSVVTFGMGEQGEPGRLADRN